MTSESADRAATEKFQHVAAIALDVLFTADPVWASDLGVESFDGRLPDLRRAGTDLIAQDLADGTAALDDLDDAHLSAEDQVDLEILRTRLTARLWAHEELAEQTWNPLLTAPDRAFSVLIDRESSDPDWQVTGFLARLAHLPDYLAAVRDQFGELSRPHTELAIARTEATRDLFAAPLVRILRAAQDRRATSAWAQLDPVRDAAVAALTTHSAWLTEHLVEATANPRLSARDYAAKLWYALDTETLPGPLLDRAESDLMALEDQLAEVAAQLAPQVGLGANAGNRQVVAVLAAVDHGSAVPRSDAVARCRTHLAALSELLSQTWLSVPPGPISVRTRTEFTPGLEWPELAEAPVLSYTGGALLPQPAPGYLSVLSLPDASGECSDEAIRHAVARAAVPGRLVQQAHARQFAAGTPVRTALASETFAVGWSWYAAELVRDALAESAPGERGTLTFAFQHLLSQIRATIAAILDVRVHTQGLTEAEGLALMTTRGHMPPPAARALWHRSVRTSTELVTGYLGYQEVSALARDIRLSQPQAGVRAQHDRMLAHGAPPPRLLRVLLNAHS